MKRLLRRYTMLAVLIAIALLWVVLLSIPFGATGGVQAADGAAGRFTLIDDSAFPTVSAYALLQDRAGNLLEGLPKDAFKLTEDGIPVQFDFTPAGEQPLTVMLVIDHSGSMQDEGKMAGAISAGQTFIDLLRPGKDTLGVTTFSDNIDTLLPLESLATAADQRDAGTLLERIDADGATRLNDAIIAAVDGMQGTTGRRVVVALTDGISDGDNTGASESTARATEAGIPVYTIGLGSDVDADQLRYIAQQTGGTYAFAPSAAELAALYADLARALQNEYSFTYASPTPHFDGTRRALDLSVDRDAGSFTTSGDYAVSGVLVLQRSPWLLAGLGGTLLILAVAPSGVRRGRRVGPVVLPTSSAAGQPALPAPSVVPVAASAAAPEPVAMPRHPYRAPLTMPAMEGNGPAHGRSFTVMLRNERTTIGSEATNDVVLPGLAPCHAAISRQDGRWVVSPAEGEIMVAYNGDATAERRIVGTNAIKHGSVIRLGTVRAIFQAKEQPELVIDGV